VSDVCEKESIHLGEKRMKAVEYYGSFQCWEDLKWRLAGNCDKRADFPSRIIRWLISRILLFVFTQKVNKKLKADFYLQAPSSEKLSSAGDFTR